MRAVSFLIVALAAAPASAAPLTLTVAVVEDPDFPPLDERLMRAAFNYGAREYALRFGVDQPRFEIRYRFDSQRFIGLYARADDPLCKAWFEARYQGGGLAEIQRYKDKTVRFWEKWSLEELKGFVPEERRAKITSHADLFPYYAERYVGRVEKLRGLKTPSGNPLVEPASWARSHVAWNCALQRQRDVDLVVTNTFLLADFLTEPHPHAVFGKLKIGGIAGPNPSRQVLGGQALLASTFGVDTDLSELSEMPGNKATFEERAKILGAFLVAHEIAHAIFGIPDVFDHPAGCLMTTRPGETYRDGLRVLAENPVPCPRCQPYVEARKLFEEGYAAHAAGRHAEATRILSRAGTQLPKHFAGGQRRRLAEITLISSQAYLAQGNEGRAKQYAELATKLDPRSERAASHLKSLEVPLLPRKQAQAIQVSRTTSTATVAPRAKSP